MNQLGRGRDGVRKGIDTYLDTKYPVLDWPRPAHSTTEAHGRHPLRPVPARAEARRGRAASPE
ncbi:hypothetical protein [Streptomyces inhibens]|uniref:hypothetical protein n=1 Tax=Streptomyces inhibens TaxID=2293571 RepID=UPI001EE6CDF8|nr:hypothetical protein [Streptomyces inhibens]UKY54833.1 hypothetical protein KI385_42735 [Streptomyces inhibens]